MSEQRTYIGKFWEIDTGGKTPEEYAKMCMERIGKTELPSYHDNWLSYFLDYEYDTTVMLKGKLYRIKISHDIDDSCFCVIHKESDGLYSFATSFYDGGTCLKEMLEDEFERI
jgi:hypothetical protein